MLKRLMILLIFLMTSCKHPAYKYIYTIEPDYNAVCYYKKLTDLEQKKVRCYPLNAKSSDGKYKFKGWMIMSVRAFKEMLNKFLDEMAAIK